ncbi:MAG: gamma carbonic anhydrase family protein [Paludibacteraceae bacterium]|nr:gamma carbonic anhydrase family protein [Paludibacteraceae bacterium]
MIKTILGHTPRFGKNCYLAETGIVIGDVIMGDNCSVWFSAVVRGDIEKIRMGHRVNVQDGAVIHVSPGFGEVFIGNDVTIGHNATVHGAKIGDNVLIGMGATLLDNCTIGTGSIIAAGALVLKNTVIGDHEVWGGVPAKFIKKITPEESLRVIKKNAEGYVEYARHYMDENPDTQCPDT